MEVSQDHLFIKLNLFLAIIAILLDCSIVEGECGMHMSSSSGTIRSPNYPRPYPPGQQCTWTVSVSGSVENIKISFSAFKLKPKSASGQCVDYVAIYSLLLNKDKDTKMKGRFCGDSKPLSMTITQSSMTVQFVSDAAVSDSYTGFSLYYKANFKDDTASKVSQTTVGIVAAIFCAVVFVGVGMLRCIMIGACNVCNAPNPPQDRQVVGTNDSYAFQADFPPSYSTVLRHPERFPSPESSPQFRELRNGEAARDSHSPGMGHGATFELQSSSSESGDSDDDDDTAPPPYPGNVHEDQAGVSRVPNLVRPTVEDGTNEHNVTAVREIPSLTVIMANEQIPSGDSLQDPLADLPILSRPINSFDAANTMNRNEGVVFSSQTCGFGNDEQIQSAASAQDPLLDQPTSSRTGRNDTDNSFSRAEELELLQTHVSHDGNTEEFTI